LPSGRLGRYFSEQKSSRFHRRGINNWKFLQALAFLSSLSGPAAGILQRRSSKRAQIKKYFFLFYQWPPPTTS
jgi:hypothetical protein